MLTYLRTSIFESPAQTLVNTVNTVGVMGKGVAKGFKTRFPSMFKEYRALCDSDRLKIGNLHLWRGKEVWVLNFPTKTTWRKPSRLEFIQAGLYKFRESYEEMGISSISFPPLGCGNGNLDWSDVRSLMEEYLSDLPIRVFIHDRHVEANFVPEHFEGIEYQIPRGFDKFHADVINLIVSSQDQFKTLRGESRFRARANQDHSITIFRDSKTDTIPFEDVEHAWSVLQSGILSIDHYSGEQVRRRKSYLFAIFANLPYVQVAEIQNVRKGHASRGYGLYFERDRSEFEDLLPSNPGQQALWRYLQSGQPNT